MEANIKALVSTGIIEKDTNGDVLLSWSYPEIEADNEQILLQRCGLKQDTIPIQFSFSKYKNDWYYIYIHINSQQTLKNVVAFAYCMIATDYNPEKYAELCKLMSALYVTNGDPIKNLEVAGSVYLLKEVSVQENYPSLQQILIQGKLFFPPRSKML